MPKRAKDGVVAAVLKKAVRKRAVRKKAAGAVKGKAKIVVRVKVKVRGVGR
jgi:hypothetical protein